MTSVFITGASSGLGAALARAYAEPGVRLGLAARRRDRLDAVAKECEERGATVHVYTVDVVDVKSVRAAVDHFLTAAKRIDLVIANAGIGGWHHPAHSTSEELASMIDINVNGVIHTIAAFLPKLVMQQHGHVVAVSSVASFRGLPGGVYSASKAAVRYLMDGWRVDLEPYNIDVTTVFPGFVTTEMIAADRNRYPFIISAERAASIMKGAIARREPNIIFPWQWQLIIPFMRVVPNAVLRWWRARTGSRKPPPPTVVQ